jgi:hypothetical protein
MAGQGRPGGLINVKSELVREHLVETIAAGADQRAADEIPAELTEALDGAAGWVLGTERANDLPSETARLAAALARHGFLTRLVEREMFAPARAPIPWLAALLEGHDGGGVRSAAASMSAELAGSEPEDRPDPGTDVPSWRVPGPGGHVRHYVALHATATHCPRNRDDKPRLGRGIRSPGELKRCWMFGFLLSCCEEADRGVR